MSSRTEAHWDHVYTSKPGASVTWFQATPTASLELLETAGLERDT
jgi:hypothetical protein